MAVYRDFDWDLRINGTLEVSGNVVITTPSTLTVNGVISGNSFVGDGSKLTNLPIPVATSTPTSGSTNPISSDWANSHSSKIGVNGGHLPTAGTTSQFLRGDGTWAIPTDTNTTYTAGGGLTLSGTQFSHTDTSNQASSTNTGRTYVQSIGLDTYGHVTSISTASESVADTWRPIETSPTTSTTNSISSSWAKTHSETTGIGSHVPSGGSAFNFLRGDGTWAVPVDSNNYVTSLSGNGNGILTVKRNGIADLTVDLVHNHTVLTPIADYTWSGNQNPRDMPKGVSSSFVSLATGFPEFGSVLSVRTYDNDGGALQLYAPYNNTYGGDRMKYRLGKYNNTGWTAWKEVLDVDHANTLYDKYGSWTLQANGANGTSITSGGTVNFVGSGATSITKSGNTITVTSTDTNTWRPVDTSPTTSATNAIASSWAKTHSETYGLGSHVPTGGTTSTFLRGDGTWVTPTDTNNYLSSVSSTDGGNGTVTFNRNGTTALTLNLSHSHSQYLSKSVDNESVGNGLTVKGALYVGSTGAGSVAGSIYLRNASGTNVIQIAGDGGAKQSSAKAYVSSSGDATFEGTVAVNKITVTDANIVSNLNAEKVGGVTVKELGRKETAYELGGWGIHSGFYAKQSGVGSQTQFNIEAGIAYTKSGLRVNFAGGDYVITTPSTTANNHRIDSIYIAGPSEGNNEGTTRHVQGTYSASPVAPAIPADGIKICDVYMGSNQGTILNAQITDRRAWKSFMHDGNDVYLRSNMYVQGGLTTTNTSIAVSKPIRGATFAKSITISSGSTSATWTHNLGLGTSYAITLSCNSAEPHVYWSSKATNSIVINLDDVCETDVIVDCLITAY